MEAEIMPILMARQQEEASRKTAERQAREQSASDPRAHWRADAVGRD